MSRIDLITQNKSYLNVKRKTITIANLLYRKSSFYIEKYFRFAKPRVIYAYRKILRFVLKNYKAISVITFGIIVLLVRGFTLNYIKTHPKQVVPTFSHNLITGTYTGTIPQVQMTAKFSEDGEGANVQVQRENSTLNFTIPIGKSSLNEKESSLVIHLQAKM